MNGGRPSACPDSIAPLIGAVASRRRGSALASQRIYLIRHGETVWNREDRVQGHLDSPLTARGEAQARAIGRTLAVLLEDDEPFVMIVSPLGRTQRSAALILAELDGGIAEVRADPGVIEVSWGRWEGLRRAEIAARDPERWAAREADRWNVPPPEGESHGRLADRAAGWLDRVGYQPRLVVVSHGAFGSTLRGVYLGLEPEAMMALDKPQDAFFRLEAGGLTRIPIELDNSRPKASDRIA